MLTWMGLIGKLIDLIVSKVVGKKVDLAFDDKKKAAKAFIRFYEATFRLEMILTAFLAYAERFIAREDTTKPTYRIIYEKTLKETLADLRGASRDFVESMQELGKALYFFDESLATLFARVSVLKMGVLKNVYYFFAQSVEAEVASEQNQGSSAAGIFDHIDHTGNVRIAKFRATSEPGNQFGSWSGIEFTIPSDTLMNLDFNEQFDQVAAYNITDFFGRAFNDFQDSVLTVIESNIESGYVGPTDKDKLIELYSKLKTHKEILTEAREKLRDFIQAQFTLSDILSVTK